MDIPIGREDSLICDILIVEILKLLNVDRRIGTVNIVYIKPKSDCMKHCENTPKPAMDKAIFISQDRHTDANNQGSHYSTESPSIEAWSKPKVNRCDPDSQQTTTTESKPQT